MSKATVNRRGGLKGVVTQIIPQLQLELDQKDLDALKASVLELETIVDKIKELDEKIVDELVENADAISAEYLAQHKFQNSYQVLLLKAKEFIKSRSTADNPPLAASNFRLTKLDIPKFDGTVIHFQSWWDQYDVAVHRNSNITPVEKFVYLKSLTTGDAALAIEGFSLTAAHYSDAVDALQDRFGKKSRLIAAHVSKLLSLEEVNGVNPKALRKHFDVMESQVRSLAALGVVADMYGCILMPILLSKIPLVIRLAWSRTGESKADMPDVHDFLTFLRNEVAAREEAGNSYVSTNVKKDTTQQRKPDLRVETGVNSSTALHVGASTRSCLFCSGEHFTSQCNDCADLPIQRRWERAKEVKACFLCLSKGHGSRDCKLQSKVKICNKCTSRHNILLCDRPKNRDSTDEENQTNQNTVIVPAHVSVDSSTRVMMYQTLVVKVKGMNSSTNVRVLLDTGAGRSFIKASLSRKLRCQHIGDETLELGTFGGGRSTINKARVVQVTLCPLEGNQEISVPMIEANCLCSPIPTPDVSAFQSKLDSLGIRLTDSSDVNVDSEIQLVIGLDLLPAIFLPVSRRIDTALFVHRTKLGWTLWGNKTIPVRSSGQSSHNVASVLSVVPNDLSDECYEDAWDLESVGIMPNESKVSEHLVLTQFLENVALRNGRCVVSLP